MKNHFLPFGPVATASEFKNPRTGARVIRIVFVEEEDARHAWNNMDGAVVDDREIHCRLEPLGGGGSGGGGARYYNNNAMITSR